MRTFCIPGGETQIKIFRKNIRKAQSDKRTLTIKFFQLKANMLITEIEQKLTGNAPINLDISTHYGEASKSMGPTNLVMNICWGWGKLSYSQVAYPDLTLFITPDGKWDYRCGNYDFEELKDWKSATDVIKDVHHNIIFDVLKLGNTDSPS